MVLSALCGKSERIILTGVDMNEEQEALMRQQICDLQEAVRLLAYHVRRGLTDPEAMRELDDTLAGTPMQ